MKLGHSIVAFSVDHHRLVAALTVGLTLVVVLLAALPSVAQLDAAPGWLKSVSRTIGFLPAIEVDTDPENMLSEDEPHRAFHNEMKDRFRLYDMVVVGVENPEHPEGVFNPESLAKIHEFTRFAKGLQFDEHGRLIEYAPARTDAPAKPTDNSPSIEGLPGLDAPAVEGLPGMEPTVPGLPGAAAAEPEPTPPTDPGTSILHGVMPKDLMGLSTVDSVTPTGGGITFAMLMRNPPETQAEALEIRAKAQRVPMLDGTIVGKDGKTVAIYIPITEKNLSYQVSQALQRKIADLGGPEIFHITGLPVAEDTFGVEMFLQMAISAPTAMVVIFVLMIVFFRKLIVVVSPMIVAMVSVILTMGALILAGFPIHIMSSMIPIFIMPIAVLDSIHIISEFFERYQATKDRRRTILDVMDALFMPMLYTSLTSAAGFASLALTPIPPVQVFGIFVAVGVMAAWILTVTFIPAFVMFIRPKRLENFGSKHHGEGEQHSWLGRALYRLGGATYRYAKPILAISLLVLAVAGYGISRININDNPVKWFEEKHEIRVADTFFNEHFAGSYMAYLSMESKPAAWNAAEYLPQLQAATKEELRRLQPSGGAQRGVFDALLTEARLVAGQTDTESAFFDRLKTYVAKRLDTSDGRDHAAWRDADLLIDLQRQQRQEVFKRPDVLAWQLGLQKALEDTPYVGKANSLSDIVRTVYRDFQARDVADAKRPELYRVPDTSGGVAEMLQQYQNSNRPDDLFHFTTNHYDASSMWVQLTTGDNQDMEKVIEAANAYLASNPPPAPIETNWFGLTYINVIWQDKMVMGMLEAFAGSFLVVFLLMTILFRSPLWGLLSMIPLTVTIAAIYGVIGLIGKDYDMPVAVLSSLTLGLAVDFAIHFLARAREMHRTYGSWQATAPHVFGEPARAIARNIIVIAAGFLPLLLAPLVPYQTVGFLLATILLVSGVGTLLILPALIRLAERWLFRPNRKPVGRCCNCGLCGIVSAGGAALLAMNFYSFTGWSVLTWIALAAIPATAITCGILSRKLKCQSE